MTSRLQLEWRTRVPESTSWNCCLPRQPTTILKWCNTSRKLPISLSINDLIAGHRLPAHSSGNTGRATHGIMRISTNKPTTIDGFKRRTEAVTYRGTTQQSNLSVTQTSRTKSDTWGEATALIIERSKDALGFVDKGRLFFVPSRPISLCID